MSTTAFTDRMNREKDTFGGTIIFALLKLLLPPRADNVKSGNYLFGKIKESKNFEWIAVRPDSLIDDSIVSEHEIDIRK